MSNGSKVQLKGALNKHSFPFRLYQLDDGMVFRTNKCPPVRSKFYRILCKDFVVSGVNWHISGNRGWTIAYSTFSEVYDLLTIVFTLNIVSDNNMD